MWAQQCSLLLSFPSAGPLSGAVSPPLRDAPAWTLAAELQGRAWRLPDKDDSGVSTEGTESGRISQALSLFSPNKRPRRPQPPSAKGPASLRRAQPPVAPLNQAPRWWHQESRCPGPGGSQEGRPESNRREPSGERNVTTNQGAGCTGVRFCHAPNVH